MPLSIQLSILIGKIIPLQQVDPPPIPPSSISILLQRGLLKTNNNFLRENWRHIFRYRTICLRTGETLLDAAGNNQRDSTTTSRNSFFIDPFQLPSMNRITKMRLFQPKISFLCYPPPSAIIVVSNITVKIGLSGCGSRWCLLYVLMKYQGLWRRRKGVCMVEGRERRKVWLENWIGLIFPSSTTSTKLWSIKRKYRTAMPLVSGPLTYPRWCRK